MDLSHLTEEQRKEALSIMVWLDHRLNWSYTTIPFTVGTFKEMWREHVGSEELIPQEYKNKVMRIYKEKKEADKSK